MRDAPIETLWDPAGALPASGLLDSFAQGAAFSHRTAGIPHGLWLPYPDDVLVHVTESGGVDRTDFVFRVHASRLLNVDVTNVAGLPMTSLARTALDLARGRTFPQALVPIDSAFRLLVLGDRLTPDDLRHLSDDDPLLRWRRAVAREKLEDAFTRVWSWPGTRVVRSALDQMDCRSESPYESSTRGHILLAGLPAPRVGAMVRGASGATYWADLLWDAVRLIGEADGVTKLGDDPQTFAQRVKAERVRQRDLEDAGWAFVRWTAGEPPRRFTDASSEPSDLPASNSNDPSESPSFRRIIRVTHGRCRARHAAGGGGGACLGRLAPG